MKPEAVAFIWDGRAMIPLDRFRPLANRQFRAGQEYALIPHRGRSEKAHGLYFKCIEVAWKTLPEKWQKLRGSNRERFPSSEHLRKWCLVQEGFAMHRDIPCKDEAAAQIMIDAMRELDPYCVLTRTGDVLTVWLAQSQDHHTMGHEEFQRSMDMVLGRLAGMLDITVKELTDNAKKNMKTMRDS